MAWKNEKDDSVSSRGSVLQKTSFFLSLLVCTGIWVAGVVFTGLTNEYPHRFGLNSTIGNVSDHYYLQVTPAGYTFAIWGLIYFWQAAWIIYTWSFVIRPHKIPTVPAGFLWMYAVANVFPPIWTVLWCKFLPIWSLPALMATPFIQYFALAIAHKYFTNNLRLFGQADVALTRILVHNGVAFYTTWVSIAWQLNLGVVLQFYLLVDPTITGGIVLTSTVIQLVVWFVLEQTVFREAMKYTLSIYPVVTWATVGIVVEHWSNTEEGRFNHVYALQLAILSFVAEILHLVIPVLCKYHRKEKPSTLTNSSIPDEHMLSAK